MKIWLHRYELQSRKLGVAARAGSLIRCEWALGQTGYSDLHPWPEYGEPQLDEHIDSLERVQFTPLVERSMEFNYLDREFRLSKRNAFAGLILPRSHKLVTDIQNVDATELLEWQKQGFSFVKLKMGRDPKAETEALVQLAYATQIQWRLDFNGLMNAAEFTAWWSALDPSVRARVDFVEDPTSGEALKISGPWANDWFKQPGARIRVVKPARELSHEMLNYDRVIFTHSMDHVFGQAVALWAAAKYYQDRPKSMDVCGLASGDRYVEDDFTRAWMCPGPRMKPTTGTGFGFDELLESLPWQRIL